MSKNYNSEKIFLKNICLISIFLFLIFLTKYSFCDDVLVVNGLTNGFNVTCNLAPDTNDCVLEIDDNDDLIANENYIYIDTSNEEYDSKNLNLVIENSCNINFPCTTSGLNNKNFKIGNNDPELNFNSIIINGSTVVFEKWCNLNYEFSSLINNITLKNNSTLKVQHWNTPFTMIN
jgi:hypothetical protein